MERQHPTVGAGAGPSILSMAALVCGILSFVGLGPIGGVAAWIMGAMELRRIDEGSTPESGRGMAKTGMILGIVAVVLSVVIGIFAMMFYGSLVGFMWGARPAG